MRGCRHLIGCLVLDNTEPVIPDPAVNAKDFDFFIGFNGTFLSFHFE